MWSFPHCRQTVQWGSFCTRSVRLNLSKCLSGRDRIRPQLLTGLFELRFVPLDSPCMPKHRQRRSTCQWRKSSMRPLQLSFQHLFRIVPWDRSYTNSNQCQCCHSTYPLHSLCTRSTLLPWQQLLSHGICLMCTICSLTVLSDLGSRWLHNLRKCSRRTVLFGRCIFQQSKTRTTSALLGFGMFLDHMVHTPGFLPGPHLQHCRDIFQHCSFRSWFVPLDLDRCSRYKPCRPWPLLQLQLPMCLCIFPRRTRDS